MDDEDAAGPLAELPDLSGLDLAQVHQLGSSDSVLVNCLRRIVEEAGSADQVIAGFDAFIDARPADRNRL